MRLFIQILGLSNSAYSLKLYADNEGMIHFNAQPAAGSTGAAKLMATQEVRQ